MQMIYSISFENDCFFWVIKGELDMDFGNFF